MLVVRRQCFESCSTTNGLPLPGLFYNPRVEDSGSAALAAGKQSSYKGILGSYSSAMNENVFCATVSSG